MRESQLESSNTVNIVLIHGQITSGISNKGSTQLIFNGVDLSMLHAKEVVVTYYTAENSYYVALCAWAIRRPQAGNEYDLDRKLPYYDIGYGCGHFLFDRVATVHA